MGLEVLVRSPSESISLRAALKRLAEGGFPTTILMVDGALVMPSAPPPEAWREVRVKTTAGTVTLSRRPGGVAVLVFGNADVALREAQERVAEALAAEA